MSFQPDTVMPTFREVSIRPHRGLWNKWKVQGWKQHDRGRVVATRTQMVRTRVGAEIIAARWAAEGKEVIITSLHQSGEE